MPAVWGLCCLRLHAKIQQPQPAGCPPNLLAIVLRAGSVFTFYNQHKITNKP